MPLADGQQIQGSPSAPLASANSRPARPQTVLWIIALLLTVIATTLVTRLDDSALNRAAMAQNAPGGTPMLGARGIYAFTGPITSRSYGLFMLDVDTGTLWCYELERSPTDGQSRLKLVAARSWIFDRYLEEFNVAAPTPSEVRALVQQQRSNAAGMTLPVPGLVAEARRSTTQPAVPTVGQERPLPTVPDVALPATGPALPRE